MQPIERYGVISLLALVVIITAVILWDQAEDEQPVQAAEPTAAEVEPRGLNRNAVPIQKTKWGTPDMEEKRREQERERQAAVAMLDAAIDDLAESKASKPAPAPSLEADRTTGWGAKPAASNSTPKDTPNARTETPSQLASNLVQERPAPQAKPSPKARTYTVAAGDTLGAIAQDQLGGVAHTQALMAANPGVDPARMSVGTVLVLPDVGSGPVASAARTQAAPKAAPASSDLGSYVVQEGDSLWKIADRALGDGSRFKDIERVNPDLDPDRLRVGQRIQLPAGASALRANASTAIASSASPSTSARSKPTNTPKKGVVR